MVIACGSGVVFGRAPGQGSQPKAPPLFRLLPAYLSPSQPD